MCSHVISILEEGQFEQSLYKVTSKPAKVLCSDSIVKDKTKHHHQNKTSVVERDFTLEPRGTRQGCHVLLLL